MTRWPASTAAAAAVVVGLLGGCGYDEPAAGSLAPSGRAVSSIPAPPPTPPATSTAPPPAPPATPTAEPSEAEPSAVEPAVPDVDPMARAVLSIPAIGLRRVPVVAYRGTPDDGPGTVIQNRGPAASPRGPGGGEAPGEVGNFIVTAHRTSHTAPFRELPAVDVGDRVLVRVQDAVFVYEVTDTRRTSFRSARSLVRQAAAVPGRPNASPTQAMITLSTCATPEDRAAGNYWSDEFGNPEHRIDKVGVLVGTRAATRTAMG